MPQTKLIARNKKQLICCLHCVPETPTKHITTITVKGKTRDWNMSIYPLSNSEFNKLLKKVKRMPENVLFD